MRSPKLSMSKSKEKGKSSFNGTTVETPKRRSKKSVNLQKPALESHSSRTSKSLAKENTALIYFPRDCENSRFLTLVYISPSKTNETLRNGMIFSTKEE